jgi:hypothetical protein
MMSVDVATVAQFATAAILLRLMCFVLRFYRDTASNTVSEIVCLFAIAASMLERNRDALGAE